MPKTPLRALRVPDELWRAVQARAKECGETVSEVVRRGLVAYVEGAPGSARDTGLTEPPPEPRASATVQDSTFLLAQGMMMQRFGLDVDEASEYLHRRAQASGNSLEATAYEVVETRLGAQAEVSRA